MASSIGIRLGRRRFEVVVLDGSAKKPRVQSRHVGAIPFDPARDDSWADAAVSALKAGLKRIKAKSDNVGLAVDAGLAAYRTLTLPFEDREKIEQVIKYEVEGELPQWDVDNVVVDFAVLNSTGVESQLLVTAVNKSDLAPLIEVCERAGAEPLEVELESTALVNAAHVAGLTGVESAEVLVHVGESSTSVVVIDGGKVRSMRAIRIGAPDLAPESEPVLEESGASEAEEATFATDLPVPTVDPRRVEDAVRRLRREIGRAVSGAPTVNPIEAVYLCGANLPGLVGSEVQGVPIESAPLFADDGEALGENVEAIAYGAALSRLGAGPMRARLRREDLRRTGKFERLELPLAILGLLLLAFLSARAIILDMETAYREDGRRTFGSDLGNGDLQLWLQAVDNYLFGDPRRGEAGRLDDPPDVLRRYVETALAGEDEVRDKFEEIAHVEYLLEQEIARLEKELGRGGEIQQPQSALHALALVLDTMTELNPSGSEGGRMGRFSIREANANYVRGTRGGPDHVEVRLDMTFFSDDPIVASEHWNNFESAVRAKPWCLGIENPGSQALEGGLAYDRISIRVSTVAAKPQDA